MSNTYRAVGWTPQKKKYDRWIGLFTLLYLATFAALALALQPHITAETIVIRAFGSLAFVLLTIILMIGPLARLNVRFLPVLFNRRHLGVATFLVAAVHGGFSIFQFHALGELHPLLSVFISDGSFSDLSAFPFQPFGALVLTVLFLMAATSHDFWLANLGAPLWKALHMAVYVGYTALLIHVAFGALQSEGRAYLWPMLAAAAVAVFALHFRAGIRERAGDRPLPLVEHRGYVRLVPTEDLVDGRGKAIPLGRERVAVFRNGNTISCVSNVCRHQMGPVGEGKIVDGCITCPWHGYQYDPVDGCSPPPFTERIETFDVLLREGYVWVRPTPNELGTSAQVGTLGREADAANAGDAAT
ncbi:MAG: Rieske 2Fe-2S domain-containing protein [Longimicrobiales bacterium]